MKQYLSRSEFAESLGISIRTLDNLIAAKQVIPNRVGTRVLISHDEYERFSRCKHHSTKPSEGGSSAKDEVQNPHGSARLRRCRNQAKADKKRNSGE